MVRQVTSLDHAAEAKAYFTAGGYHAHDSFADEQRARHTLRRAPIADWTDAQMAAYQSRMRGIAVRWAALWLRRQ